MLIVSRLRAAWIPSLDELLFALIAVLAPNVRVLA